MRGFLLEVVREWRDDAVPRLAAALAYYTLFAVAPLGVMAVAIAGAVYGQAAARGELSARLGELLGPDAASLVERLLGTVASSESNILVAVAGGILVVYGSARAFLQLQSALNHVWGITIRPGAVWWRVLLSRLVPFCMVVGTGVLLLVSLVAGSAMRAVEETLPVLGDPVASRLLEAAAWLFVGLLLFSSVFKFLPDVRLAWRDVWAGGLLTSVFFGVGRYLSSIYLETSGVSSVYGAAGSVVVLLLWVYYSAQAVLLGAEFTQVRARRRGTGIRPADYAMRVRRVADTDREPLGEEA